MFIIKITLFESVSVFFRVAKKMVKVFLILQNMGYKCGKPRKLVSLITVAGRRRPQSLIVMESVTQKQNLINPYRVIVVYSG